MALHYCYYSTFFWCWAASIYNPRPPPLAKCMPHPHTGAHLAFRAIDFYMRTQFSICRYYSQTLEWHVWYIYYVISLVFARTKNNRRRIFQRYVYIYIFNTRRTRIHLFMSNQCERVSDPSNPSARTPITPHTHSDRGPVSGKFLDFPHMYIVIRTKDSTYTIRSREICISRDARRPSSYTAFASYDYRTLGICTLAAPRAYSKKIRIYAIACALALHLLPIVNIKPYDFLPRARVGPRNIYCCCVGKLTIEKSA